MNKQSPWKAHLLVPICLSLAWPAAGCIPVEDGVPESASSTPDAGATVASNDQSSDATPKSNFGIEEAIVGGGFDDRELATMICRSDVNEWWGAANEFAGLFTPAKAFTDFVKAFIALSKATRHTVCTTNTGLTIDQVEEVANAAVERGELTRIEQELTDRMHDWGNYDTTVTAAELSHLRTEVANDQAAFNDLERRASALGYLGVGVFPRAALSHIAAAAFSADLESRIGTHLDQYIGYNRLIFAIQTTLQRMSQMRNQVTTGLITISVFDRYVGDDGFEYKGRLTYPDGSTEDTRQWYDYPREATAAAEALRTQRTNELAGELFGGDYENLRNTLVEAANKASASLGEINLAYRRPVSINGTHWHQPGHTDGNLTEENGTSENIDIDLQAWHLIERIGVASTSTRGTQIRYHLLDENRNPMLSTAGNLTTSGSPSDINWGDMTATTGTGVSRGARYVRVSGRIRATEVIVLGANLARRQVASQSTTVNGQNPGRALDGHRNLDNPTATSANPEEWWQVAFGGAERKIRSVAIFPGRRGSPEMQLLRVTAFDRFGHQHHASVGANYTSIHAPIVAVFDDAVDALRVRIIASNRRAVSLQFAEVEVYDERFDDAAYIRQQTQNGIPVVSAPDGGGGGPGGGGAPVCPQTAAMMAGFGMMVAVGGRRRRRRQA